MQTVVLVLAFVNIFAWQYLAWHMIENGGWEVLLVKLHRLYNQRYLDFHYRRVTTFEFA